MVSARVVDMVSIVKCEETTHASRHMWIKIRVNANTNIFIGVVYMLVDNSKVEAKREIMEETSAHVHRFARDGEVYVVGDFNARVGVNDSIRGNCIGAFGEVNRNVSGDLLIRWLKQENMVIFNGRESEKGTQYTRVINNSQSILDYIIGSESSLHMGAIKGVLVMDGEQDFIGSDHRLVVADLKVNIHIRWG